MRRIEVREASIDLAEETAWLRGQLGDSMGALVSFLGTVRGEGVSLLELEHHPRMTHKSLDAIVEEAEARWSLLGVSLIHRIGALQPGEDIVLVLVASRHRRDAFDACDFLMDYLKTEAVFWKREHSGSESRWIESTGDDDVRKARWQSQSESVGAERGP